MRAFRDRYQLLIFAPAFWNGRDPILKERLFGLTPQEGNHGEDVKECYFHLDNTPTHSYMKFLYKYPQGEFPYARLVEENRRRLGQGPEFELLDTGIFNEDRYFDIVIEYAKVTTEDLCIRIEAFNRGPQPAPLHLIPHLWFRNTWAWHCKRGREPAIRPGAEGPGYVSLVTDDSTLETLGNVPVQYRLGPRVLYGPGGGAALFTNNETNLPRVFGPRQTNRTPYVKDAFHRALVGNEACTNPDRVGTKAALHYRFTAIPPGGSVVLRLRLTDQKDLSAPLPTSTGRSASAAPRPTIFTTAFIPARRRRMSGGSSGRRGGFALDEAELSVRRQCLAGRRLRGIGRRRPPGRTSATSTGGISIRCGS